MSGDDLEWVRRLVAWEQRRPVPRRETLPVQRRPESETWVLTGVRMGGEVLPWALAMGTLKSGPEVFAVVEPRSVGAVVRMLARFSAKLKEWLQTESPLWVSPGVEELLHLVALRFSRAQKGPSTTLERVRELGRACDFVFAESTRPGQCLVHEAGAVLRELYTFPAEDHRQQHLGFLLGWLSEGREEAARRRERRAASDLLDPELERRRLEPSLKRGGEDEVLRVVRREVLRRWRWVREAVWRIDADPRPELPGLHELEELTSGGRARFWQRERARRETENPFDPDARGDGHPAAGASRFYWHVHGQEKAAEVSRRGDALLRLAGQAAGELLEVELVAAVDEGEGRAKEVVWTLWTPYTGSLRLREGAKVCDLADPYRRGYLRKVRGDARGRTLELRLLSGTRASSKAGRASALDPRLIGQRFVLGPLPSKLNQLKAYRAWKVREGAQWLEEPRPTPTPDVGDVLRTIEQLKET